MKLKSIEGTIHRHDEGGPTAEVTCNNDSTASATWKIPEGQLLNNASAPEELTTGGYTYFTPNDAPTDVISGAEGGQHADFSGQYMEGGYLNPITTKIEYGVEYRAHILLAYEDGPAWHNDTVFVCPEPTTEVAVTIETPAPDVLPFTGFDPILSLIGAASIISGALLIKFSRWAKS